MRLLAAFALVAFLSLINHTSSQSMGLQSIDLESDADNVYQFNGTSDPIGTLFTRDIAIGYALSQDVNINVNLDPGAAATYLKLSAGTQDFAVSSTRLFTNLDSLKLVSMPFFLSAIAPVYRIDALGSLAPPLRLTMRVCALIWMGDITTWDDPEITSINPYITLPNQRINVVFPAGASAQGEAVTAAMGAAWAPFAAMVPPSTNPTWPIGKYLSYTACKGFSCVPAATVTTDGSLGFSALQNAIENGVRYASYISADGTVVPPSISAQSFAFVELSTIAATATGDDSRMASYLTNSKGSASWPIVEVSWLIMKPKIWKVDEQFCIRRAHLLSFIMFSYVSNQAQQIRDNHNNARIPDQGLVSLQTVYQKLKSSFLCNGNSSYSLAVALGLPYVDAINRVYTMSSYSEYESVFTSMLSTWSREEQKRGELIDWSFESTRDTSVAYENIKNGTLDLGFVLYDDLNATQQLEFLEFQSSGKYLMIPLFSFGIVPVYSRQLTSSITLPPVLQMDVMSIFLLFIRLLTTWDSPQLTMLNPSLAGTNAPVRSITYCNNNDGLGFSGTVADKAIKMATPFIVQHISQLNLTELPNVNAITSCTDQLFDQFALSSTAPPVGIFPAPTQNSVTPLLTVTTGSFSTVLYKPSVETSVGMVDLIFSGTNSTHASIGAFLKCFDVSQTIDLKSPLKLTTTSECWSLSRPMYAMVPSSFDDVNNDGCYGATHILETLRWLVEEASLDSTFEMAGLARAGNIPEMRKAMMKAINSVECVNQFNGQRDTILVSQSVKWELSESITIAGTTLSGIGLALVLASLICLAIYRNHHALVSAAPMFIALTALGVGLLLVAAIFLSFPASDTNCTVLSWTMQIGFMLTLAPIFMKTYRVYRVISGKQLSVVKISNKRLLFLIAVGVAIELVLLIVAQAISPLQPLQTVVLQGSPIARNHIYSICNLENGAGTTIFGIQAGLKGLLLLGSGIMGFSTRRVASSFNESSNIAWSIYNVILSLGLVALIAALVDAQGDTLVALLLFALLWIAFTTMFLNVGPRITGLASKPVEMNAQDSGTRVSSHGFSLLSVAAFTESKALTAYAMAIDTQLAQAKARLAMIHNGDYTGKDWTRAGVSSIAAQTVTSSNALPVIKSNSIKPSVPVPVPNRHVPAASLSSGNVQAPLLNSANQEPVRSIIEPMSNNSPKHQLGNPTSASADRRASSRTALPICSASRIKQSINLSTSMPPEMAINVTQQSALSPTQSTSPKNAVVERTASNLVAAPTHARTSSHSSKSTAKVSPLALSGAAVVLAATQGSASSKSNSAWVGPDRPAASITSSPSNNQSTLQPNPTHQKSLSEGSMDHPMGVIDEVDTLANDLQNNMKVEEDVVIEANEEIVEQQEL